MEMKLALDVVGGFKIEHRGLVDVKVRFISFSTNSYAFGRIHLCYTCPREKV